MAWKNVITGYTLKRFDVADIIPIDAIYVRHEKGNTYLCGSYYPYEWYVYQIPIYKKQNIKTKQYGLER